MSAASLRKAENREPNSVGLTETKPPEADVILRLRSHAGFGALDLRFPGSSRVPCGSADPRFVPKPAQQQIYSVISTHPQQQTRLPAPVGGEFAERRLKTGMCKIAFRALAPAAKRGAGPGSVRGGFRGDAAPPRRGQDAGRTLAGCCSQEGLPVVLCERPPTEHRRRQLLGDLLRGVRAPGPGWGSPPLPPPFLFLRPPHALFTEAVFHLLTFSVPISASTLTPGGAAATAPLRTGPSRPGLGGTPGRRGAPEPRTGGTGSPRRRPPPLAPAPPSPSRGHL